MKYEDDEIEKLRAAIDFLTSCPTPVTHMNSAEGHIAERACGTCHWCLNAEALMEIRPEEDDAAPFELGRIYHNGESFTLGEDD